MVDKKYMRKLIFFILITGLLVFRVSPVMAEKQSGNSAELSLSIKINKEEQDSLNLKRKELAIKSVLNRYNSPMVGSEQIFIKACSLYNLDCYLLPSIAGLESTFGRFIWPDSYNPFGWGRGFLKFADWSESIDSVAKGLKENYIEKGAVNIYDIGSIYSESPTWATRVSWFMKEFEKEEGKLSLLSVEIPVKL